MDSAAVPPLRIAWDPAHPPPSRNWWPASPPHDPGTPAGNATAGAGVGVTRDDAGWHIQWHDPSWPPGPVSERQITVAITPDRMEITVPPAWRAAAYYGWRGPRLLVSSSIRVLAAALSLSAPDPAATASFLACGHSIGRGDVPSLIRGIRRVEPGHAVLLSAGRATRSTRRWRPDSEPAFRSATLEQAVHAVRRDLDAQARQLAAAHDRIACLFSGGLDSTLIAATLMRHCPGQVRLMHAGSGLGTPAEATLRQRFLHQHGASSLAVGVPRETGLLDALRSANQGSDFPVSCLFTHVFHAIIGQAASMGCDVLVTGDGGDEAFAERELLLTDLLATRRYRHLVPALGYFAARRGERSTRLLARARARLWFLGEISPGLPAGHENAPGSAPPAHQGAAGARADRWQVIRQLWREGWPASAADSYLRAAGVPEWEPAGPSGCNVSAVSPLASARLVQDGLSLRRDALVRPVAGFQPKWLLRLAALDRLPASIAMHPKIGSADGQILAAISTQEREAIISLLTGPTARAAGIRLPADAHDPASQLWQSGDWARPAALVTWLDSIQEAPQPASSRPAAQKAACPGSGQKSPPGLPSLTPAASPQPRPAPTGRPGAQPGAFPDRQVPLGPAIGLAILNLAAQARHGAQRAAGMPAARAPGRLTEGHEQRQEPGRSRDTLIAAARLACALPFADSATATVSQAITWYLQLHKTPAVLVTGTAQGETTARYWVHSSDGVIDISGCEKPLTPGGP
jgi:hypothetical protein